MRYRTFAPRRDEKLKRMEEARKVARAAEVEYYDYIQNVTITEEVEGFKVFLDGLPPTWRVYEHDGFSMMRGYSTVDYRKATGEWVWMIDADRPPVHGWTSKDPREVLAVMRDNKV